MFLTWLINNNILFSELLNIKCRDIKIKLKELKNNLNIQIFVNNLRKNLKFLKNTYFVKTLKHNKQL